MYNDAIARVADAERRALSAGPVAGRSSKRSARQIAAYESDSSGAATRRGYRDNALWQKGARGSSVRPLRTRQIA